MSDETNGGPVEAPVAPEDDPNQDPNGVHPASNVEVANHHFNVLKVVRDAKAAFEAANPGKIAAYFYAPEALLYLIDRSVKSAALSSGFTDKSVLAEATVTQVYGMELLSVAGTCVTITAEPVHEEEEVEVTGIPMPPPTNSALN